MNYYERHIGDYLKDTAHLSLLEHGVYTRLMDVYYTREGAIPACDAARLIGARSKDEREALAVVLAEFFVLTDGAHAQHRCDREIARFQDKQSKAKRSADARWNAQRSQSEGSADASPNAMRTHSEGNADGMHRAPVPSNQTPVTKPNPTDASHPPGEARERAAPSRIAQPDGVDPQVWSDFLTHRKAKKAPVTATVIASATSEAAKAGMSLNAFLQVWCARGSQGLQADWIKPEERRTASPATWAQQRDETMAAFAGNAAQRKAPAAAATEVIDVAARRLG